MVTKKSQLPPRRSVAKSKGNKVGRPTVMTAMLVSNLEQAFLWGCSDQEACLYAGISKQTLYEYQKKKPEFIDRKAMLKRNLALKARQVIFSDLEAGNVKTAKYVIDKEDGRARQALEIVGKVENKNEREWVVTFVNADDVKATRKTQQLSEK